MGPRKTLTRSIYMLAFQLSVKQAQQVSLAGRFAHLRLSRWRLAPFLHMLGPLLPPAEVYAISVKAAIPKPFASHTFWESNENHSSFPEKKTTVLQRYINTNFIWHFKRLKRPLETHHITLMVEPEANQSKNQGVIFFLVKEMFQHAHTKNREKCWRNHHGPNSEQHSAILVSSIPLPTLNIFAFAGILK